MGFQVKMGVLGGKIREGVVRYWPITNSVFLLGVLTSVPILVKIDQEMRACESARRRTHWQAQTDFISERERVIVRPSVCRLSVACL